MCWQKTLFSCCSITFQISQHWTLLNEMWRKSTGMFFVYCVFCHFNSHFCEDKIQTNVLIKCELKTSAEGLFFFALECQSAVRVALHWRKLVATARSCVGQISSGWQCVAGRAPALGRNCQIYSRRCPTAFGAALHHRRHHRCNIFSLCHPLHCGSPEHKSRVCSRPDKEACSRSKLDAGFSFGRDTKFSHAKQPQRFQIVGAIFHIYQLSEESASLAMCWQRGEK